MNDAPHCGPGNDPARRDAMITGLRELAAFLERTPGFPVDECAVADLHYYPRGADADQRAEVDRVARLVGAESEDNGKGYYRATRFFGPVMLGIACVDAVVMRGLFDES